MKTTKSEPTAKIAVKKNVLKQYRVDNEDVVYLAKDAEFEIELFNPTQDTILARIFLSNEEIPGNGLILRPGERVFLERYLTEDKKFKFDVYEVENTLEVKNAIANNGLVTIKFYRKQYDLTVRTPWAVSTWYNTPTPYVSPTVLYNSTGTIMCNTSLGNSALTSVTANSANSTYTSKSIDTGIVAKGSNSQQELEYVDMDFYQYPFSSTVIRILPDTRKPYTTEEIKYRKYCTECGSKIKATDKFCAECGTKL